MSAVLGVLYALFLEFDVCLLIFAYGRSKQMSSLLKLDLCGFHHRFIYGQSIFFISCDCRCEGVVPANTLKRLVRKRNKKTYFSQKLYSEVDFELLPTMNSQIVI